MLGQFRSVCIGRICLLGLALVAAAGASMRAQGYSADKAVGPMAQQLPAYLEHAGIEQHLNQQLPQTATFTDDRGQVAPLSQWVGRRPTVMALVYYKCTMMCPEVLHGLATGLKQTTLKAGEDYNLVTFSIDPTDTASDAGKEKTAFVAALGLHDAEGSIHFLTGVPASIEAVSNATGFQYVRVPGPDGKLDQFAHSSVIMFATPDGRLSKYMSGVDYPARDLRLALLDASEKRISNPVDLFLIYCCSYNPVVGRYSVTILRVVSIAGMVTLVGLIGLFLLLRRSATQPA